MANTGTGAGKRIGGRIRAERFRAGLSVPELADRAGLCHTVVYRAEAGGPRGPHIATVRKLADALGVPVTSLLDAA